MKRYSWCTWSGLSGMVMTSCLVPSLEADLPESVGGPGNGSGTGGATTRTKSTVTGGRANSTNTRPSSDASSIAFGGGSAIASGGSGGTTACGTTPSKFDPIETDFGLSSSLAGSGFREHSGSGIKDGVIEYVKTTANLCSSGCLHLSAPFTKGIQAWSLSSSLIVEKELPGATNDTGVNLVGARIVAMVSVSNPDNVPVMFEIFAQGSAPDWGWSGGLDGASTLGDLGAFKEFAFLVHDATSVSDGRTLTFCASDTVKYGFKIQASKTITNDGTVDVYIQSMTVYPAGGYAVGTGGAGGAASVATGGRPSGVAGTVTGGRPSGVAGTVTGGRPSGVGGAAKGGRAAGVAGVPSGGRPSGAAGVAGTKR